MDLLKRGAIQAPAVPAEQVDVPELGGAVLVRGMMLSDRLQFSDWRATVAKAAAGETDEQAHARTGSLVVARLLSVCVVDADGAPIFTMAQWEQFGAQHAGRCLALFDIAWKSSGFDEVAIVKNS